MLLLQCLRDDDEHHNGRVLRRSGSLLVIVRDRHDGEVVEEREEDNVERLGKGEGEGGRLRVEGGGGQGCGENEVGGCTNPSAANYNPDATEDDFCLFFGCLDNTACNFDPSGFYNELIVCEYDSCSGCTNPLADNYNSEATQDDGSCIISGCMDNTACNYDVEANTDDGSCVFALENFDCEGNCITSIDCNGDCGGDAVLDNCGTCDNDDSNDCIQDCAGEWGGLSVIDSCGDCGGNGPSVVCWDDSIVCESGDCLVQVFGCMDSNACNYNSEANTDDGSCVFALEGFDCDGNELELDSPWGNSDGCDPW